MSYEINYYCVNHIGKWRKNNQDNFLCIKDFLDYENNGSSGVLHGRVSTSPIVTFGVFDGMGGEEKGEMAAYIAAKKLSEAQLGDDMEQGLLAFCKSANADICKYTEDNLLTSMGTTAAILSFLGEKICLCNIGDSKIFLLSKNDLKQISYDHVYSLVGESKPPLTQNLGIQESEMIISPYVAFGECNDKDIYLICSDGLTDMVSCDEIKNILCASDRMQATENLLKKALDNGGKDNITLIVLYVEKQKNKLIKFLRKRCRHDNC